jgi:hypothetical protein
VNLPWQRATIQAAALYLRERIGQGDSDPKTKVIYEGLLEVLDPPRRAVRIQREMAAAAKAAAVVKAAAERRSAAERRRREDRRKQNLGSPTGLERRSGGDRRAGRDRRNRG